MKVLTVSKGALTILVVLFLVTVITAVIYLGTNENNSESTPPQIEIVLPEGEEN